MNQEEIERILSDFREWLAAAPPPAPPPSAPEVSLHTLVAQFTALRHEVNLQTKASRSTLEQNGEALTQLRTAVEQLQEQPEADDGLGPLLKSLIDVYDNLAMALKQVTKQREAIEKPLAELSEPSTAAAPGFLARLFGARPVVDRSEAIQKAVSLVRTSLESLQTGYRMSLARIDRALEQHEMEVIAAEGEAFDPELMEVVEVVADSGKVSGQVIEEVRRGYIRDEVVFRFAQVKVAK